MDAHNIYSQSQIFVQYLQTKGMSALTEKISDVVINHHHHHHIAAQRHWHTHRNTESLKTHSSGIQSVSQIVTIRQSESWILIHHSILNW